jgi:hypothetical protein
MDGQGRGKFRVLNESTNVNSISFTTHKKEKKKKSLGFRV